jgi:hypothetical protein
MRIAKKNAFVLADGLDGLFCCLLGQETLIFPKGFFRLGLLCQGKASPLARASQSVELPGTALSSGMIELLPLL